MVITIHIEIVLNPFVVVFTIDRYFHRFIESFKKSYDAINGYLYFIHVIN